MKMRPTSRPNMRHRPTLPAWRSAGWLVAALGLLVAAGPAWAQAPDKAKPEVPDAKRADKPQKPAAQPVVEEDLCASKHKGKKPAAQLKPTSQPAGKLQQHVGGHHHQQAELQILAGLHPR